MDMHCFLRGLTDEETLMFCGKVAVGYARGANGRPCPVAPYFTIRGEIVLVADAEQTIRFNSPTGKKRRKHGEAFIYVRISN